MALIVNPGSGGNTNFTDGSIPYASGGILVENNSKIRWDNTNSTLYVNGIPWTTSGISSLYSIFTPSGTLSVTTVAAQLDKIDVVTDRATLQAWPAAPIANKLVLLLGFTTPGDGGQGILYWSAASVVADDGGITTKLTAVTTGRFIKIF